MKKMLSLLLSAVLCVGLLAVPANATDMATYADSLAASAERLVGKSRHDLEKMPSGDWCCYFVAYCLNRSSMSSLVGSYPVIKCQNPKSIIYWAGLEKKIGTFYVFSRTHYNALIQSRDGLSVVLDDVNNYVPKRGDIAIFDWNGREDVNHCYSHAGIVTGYNANSGRITLIDGNSKEGSWTYVNQKTRDKNFNGIIGYVHWGDNEEATEPPDPVIFQPDDGLYNIVPACAPNSALDVANKRTDNEANLHIWQRGDNWSNQQWNLERVDGDYYKITNENSGRAVSIQYDSTASGSDVWQYGYGHSNAQKWRFEEAGDGYYYIVPKINTDLCLDVSSASSTDGANVQVYEKNQTNAQKWKLVPVEKPIPIYTVYFDANGGSVAQTSKTVKEGDTIGAMPKPSRKGYTFQGWGSEREGSYMIVTSNNLYILEDTTLYAHWEKIEPAPTTPTPAPETPEPLPPIIIEPEQPPVSEAPIISEPPVTPSPEPEKKWHFTEWSDWSDTEYKNSDTRQVETRQVEGSPAKTQYRYGNFTIGGSDIWDVDYGYSLGWKGTVKENWTEWRDTPIPYVDRKTYCSDTSHDHQHVKSYEVNGWATWYLYREDGIWDGWSRPYYYWEETRTVEATYKTQYRYRDWVKE